MPLKKTISFWGVFSIAAGAMISSGIFILPGYAYAQTGPSLFLSYLAAGILGLVGILSVIELSTAMPKAGGDFYFINKAFGPALGTMSGILGWVALSLKSSFAVFGITEIIHLFTGADMLLTGLGLCLFFVLLNIGGVKEAVTFQIILVTGLLTLMLVYIVFGLPALDSTRYTPFLKGGVNGIFVTSGFIFISFGGLLNVANISEEVKNPRRNLPLGIILSVVVVTLFYTAITFVITGTLEGEKFASSLTPVADSARNVMGEPGYYIILVASLLAFITTANAGIMSASRYPLSLSRDRLMPAFLGRIGSGRETPVWAIILTGLIIFLSLLLPLELLVKAASTVILTSYVLTNIALIILRESGLTNYKPSFRAPFYPYLQILCIFLFSFFIADMGQDAMEISLALIFLSFCLYIIYGRKEKRRESALLHLLKRITDSRLTGNLLEDELREALIQRDEIGQDNFDELVKKATILDWEAPCSFEEMVEETADIIAGETGMDRDRVIAEYLKRQRDSNTAITPFLAIPHILTEGEKGMFLIIIRSSGGIVFTGNEKEVKAVFLLGGTADNRTLHLKALASIATIAESDGFNRKWLEAANETELKNLLLLSDRKRL